MQKLLILILIILFASFPATAQDTNVEINLDTLQGYTPPPMFEETEPEALTPMPAVAPAPVEIIKTANVPIPQRKPPFSGTLKKRNVDRIEEQVVLQTAKDILRQIEGDTPKNLQEIAREEEPPEPTLLQQIVKKPVIQENVPITLNGPFEISIPYKPDEATPSNEHRRILLEQIFTRLHKYEDAHLEVRAYASSPALQKSPARRLSLERALGIQDFLLSKGIAEERIYLRPLGQAVQSRSDTVQLVVSRL